MGVNCLNRRGGGLGQFANLKGCLVKKRGVFLSRVGVDTLLNTLKFKGTSFNEIFLRR